MNETIATPKEVAQAIKQDILQKRGLKLAEAARMLNTSPQNLQGLLSGRARYRIKTANLFNHTFGYSIDYLLEGRGSLYGREDLDLPESGLLIVDPDPFGSFCLTSEGLTERQAFLNRYAHLLSPIFSAVTKDFPTSGVLDITADTSCFEAQDGTEMKIFKYIVFCESIIRQFLRPENIVEELNALSRKK